MSVTVVFEGICTHVRKDEKLTPWLDVPHRVVLANARKPGFGIPDHVGTLHIDENDLAIVPKKRDYLEPLVGKKYAWKILGAALSIPSRGTPDYPNPECMLHMPPVRGFAPLRKLVSGEKVTASEVDAFFDITAGTFINCCFGEAYGATLTIEETEGNPRLVVKPFDREKPDLDIYLNPGATVTVRHTAEECTIDDRHHFLLHYLIGGAIPKGVPLDKLVPCGKAKGCVPCPKDDTVSLGIGCSSSGYP